MRKPFTQDDIYFIKKYVSLEISPKEIAELLDRTIGSIENRIRRLNLVYKSKIKKLSEQENRMEDIMGKRAKFKEQEARKQKQFLDECRNYSPMLSEKWQAAIVFTKAKLINYNGQKVYCINGKPVTIFRIMELYDAHFS